MKAGLKRVVALVVTVSALALGASLAHAALTEQGDLFVRFDGGIAPTALPRRVPASIAVRVGGTIRTLAGRRPPALRQIKIELNRNGHLDTRGLPICRMARIQPSSPREAMEACGPALVGGGRYAANTAFPEQEAFPSRGHILAFNTVIDGHPAILAHVFGTDPVTVTRIIVFHIRSTAGTYGTVLTGALPASVNRYGYVRSIELNLHRDFVYRGRRHSYLSAACTAPPGFPGATFPFARASMTFADGRTLSSILTRSCRVRGA